MIDDELRDRIRTLADTARIVSDGLPIGALVSGEDRTQLDWLATELAALDMELSVEALRS